MAIVLLVAAGLLVLAAFFANGSRPSGPDVDSAPMSRRARTSLVAYFLSLALVLIYLIVQLYLLDFPDTVVSLNSSASDPDVKALSQANGPALFYAFPHLKAAPTPASGPTYELALYGDHIQAGAKVRLNGQLRPQKAQLDDNLIRVVPEPGDAEGVGSLVVEIVNPDGHLSNALHLPITRPRMFLRFGDFAWAITRETQLILLVLAAGALGSFIHALKSLADFIGNRTAQASWYWWYITRPFLGATLAFIFYAVLRGGFLTGTPADVKVVNPFGAIAVAALVGMFSDKATQKLAEVFETLFKADDRRTGKLAGPVVSKLTPPTVRAGSQQPVDLTIVGERLSKASAVKVSGIDRAPDKVDDKQVVVKLLPADLATSGTILISVVTPDGTSPSATLHVSTLEITTKALPAASQGTQYDADVEANGGTTPYKWSAEGLPAGLAIAEKGGKGKISGTPAAAGGGASVLVTVTDKTGASDSKAFTMS
jgi:hypothetical protein